MPGHELCNFMAPGGRISKLCAFLGASSTPGEKLIILKTSVEVEIYNIRSKNYL